MGTMQKNQEAIPFMMAMKRVSPPAMRMEAMSPEEGAPAAGEAGPAGHPPAMRAGPAKRAPTRRLRKRPPSPKRLWPALELGSTAAMAGPVTESKVCDPIRRYGWGSGCAEAPGDGAEAGWPRRRGRYACTTPGGVQYGWECICLSLNLPDEPVTIDYHSNGR